LERKHSWLNLGNIPAFVYYQGKPRNASLKITDVWAEIRTAHFPNISRYRQPAQGITVRGGLISLWLYKENYKLWD
jgi:hypothetical protein